ncbi:MAG: hypothetical protein MUO77_12590 [Anaerolineales bacterium]|nr:hypothetical protein [Anaerolineales bacterium]
MIVFACLLLLFAGNLFLANLLPPSGEFLLLREGGRAFLFDKLDPYSASVPARVQEKVYQRPAKDGEEPYILDVPFHLLIPYFPFALGDEMLARGIFFFLLETALFLIVFFGMRLAVWEPARLHLLLFFVVSLLNFYTVNAFLNGTPAIFLLLTYVGIIFSLQNYQDELAGALLVFACIQWEIGGAFFLLIMFYVFRSRRWQVLVGFVMLAFVLMLISYLWYPGWMIPFLRAAYNNWIADFGFTVQPALKYIWPQQAAILGWILTGMTIIILGYEWNKVSDKDFRRLYWTSCLTLAIAPFLGFRIELEQLVVLILPLGLILKVMSGRWERFGNILTLTFLILYFAIPWLIFLQAVPRFGHKALEILFLFLPALTVIGLYWIRWWALHPPRTWADERGNIR